MPAADRRRFASCRQKALCQIDIQMARKREKEKEGKKMSQRVAIQKINDLLIHYGLPKFVVRFYLMEI